MDTTEQVKKPPNPTGKGGFGDNPQNRNPGGWDPKHTFSYQMNRFKAMTVTEFMNYEREVSEDERTVAESLAYARVAGARKDINDFREVANRTEGAPKQSFDHTSNGQSMTKLIVEIVNGSQDTSDESISKES